MESNTSTKPIPLLTTSDFLPNTSTKHQKTGDLLHTGAHLATPTSAVTEVGELLEHNDSKEKPGLKAYIDDLQAAINPPPVCQDVGDAWVIVDHGTPGQAGSTTEQPWSVLENKMK